jgi:hypothetical protein
MKNFKYISGFLFAAVFITAIFLLCTDGIDAKTNAASAAPSFEETKAWNKVGETLQTAWLAAKKSGNMEQRFKCFVRVQAPFNMGDQSFLQSAGFNVQVFSGTVGRGSVSAAQLPRVTNLPFVKKINLSSKKK